MSVDPSLLPDIEARVSILESAVHELVANVEAKYGKPDLFEVGGHPRTRYPWARPVHARVLKAVRVISALHAVNTLLEVGFVAESAVLFRVIDDFLEDIDFLRPDEHGQLNDRQQEFVQQYFDEDERPIEERAKDPRNPPSVPRRKIRAHEARKVAEVVGDDDVHGTIGKSWVIDELFSGAVHGSYPSTMDLFGGPDRKQARFHMKGMASTPRMPSYVTHFALYVHRALNVVSLLALDLEQTELSDGLLKARIVFEESEAYPNDD